jgi:hypothetical protein
MSQISPLHDKNHFFALCILQAIRGGDHDFAIKEKIPQPYV